LHFFRHSLVDVLDATPQKSLTPTHLRWAKLIGAYAVSLLAGVGSYTVTYRALVLVTESAAAAPVTSQSPGSTHAQTSPAPEPIP